jgi:hypothetical protein
MCINTMAVLGRVYTLFFPCFLISRFPTHFPVGFVERNDLRFLVVVDMVV